MKACLLVPRRDDTLYRRDTSLNFIAGGLQLQLADTDGSDSGEYFVWTYRLIRHGRAMRCGGLL